MLNDGNFSRVSAIAPLHPGLTGAGFPCAFHSSRQGLCRMPKPNYSFEKRKREMDKKAKKAEKAKRKAEGKPEEGEGGAEGETGATPAAENP
jgi:hypothetical protein